MTSPYTTKETELRVFRRDVCTDLLGPGRRAVIWVQGCPLTCPGCIVPESWSIDGGWSESVTLTARWVREQGLIDGITISGGEPMWQAKQICHLLDELGSSPGVVTYSGFTYEYLLRRGSAEQQELLRRIDVLIDGPYVEARHDDLLWRGSTNQQIRHLTERYLSLTSRIADKSAGVEVGVATEGLWITGVPPKPHFRMELEESLRTRGVIMRGTV